MADENRFLLHAILMGIYITFIYDFFRIFRRVIPHKKLFISLEDIIFWGFCAIEVFILMYEESNGTLRWFAVLGALVGMLVYKKFISNYFVWGASWILQRFLHFLYIILTFFLKPFIFIYKKARTIFENKKIKKMEIAENNRELLKIYPSKRKWNEKYGTKIKNKLTRILKMINIMLYKQ